MLKSLDSQYCHGPVNVECDLTKQLVFDCPFLYPNGGRLDVAQGHIRLMQVLV